MAEERDEEGLPVPRATPRAIISLALLDQAAAALERKPAKTPQDWRNLGDIHRRRGDFPSALAAYRRLQALKGDATANWLVAVAGGDNPPKTAPNGTRPVPFVRLTNFFTPTQRERLLALSRQGPDAFRPAPIYLFGQHQLNPQVRNGLILRRRGTQELRRWFVPKLRRLLPRIATRLQIGEIGRRFIEMQLTAYLTGGVFRPHSDTGSNARNRLISYTCYFHDEPRRFQGGELLLYDDAGDGGSTRRSFSRFDPVGNSALFFASHYFHEVLGVTCPSDGFLDGRFTVNGWVRDRALPELAPGTPPGGPAPPPKRRQRSE